MAQNQSNWEADKMLDIYIYDYLLKKKLNNTAKSFMTEGKVSPDPVAIDAPGGFLFEWWSVFWDIFIARTNEKHSEPASAYIEAQHDKAREQQQQQQQQQLQMQQFQLIRQAQMQRRDSTQPPIGGLANVGTTETMPVSQPLLDARMALLKPPSSQHGQLLQGNSGGIAAALQQMQDIKSEVNMGTAQRSLPVNSSSLYGQGMMQQRPGVGNPGINPCTGDLPLKGFPLAGIDSIRPNLGAHVQKPIMNPVNQLHLLPQQQLQQQHQLLAQIQSQGNSSNPSIFGEMDPRIFRGMPRGSLNAKDGQMMANDASAGSPMQSSSSKMNMPHIQPSSSQQPHDQIQPQQVQQQRKRKGLSSSGPANSTGTGNTIGPSPNSQPSTPSTHTPGDGVSMASNTQQATSMSKGLMMYGTNGLGGLTSSTNQLDDIDHFGDVGSLEDNVESFLSADDVDGRDVFGKLKQNQSELAADLVKGLSFSEVSSIRESNSKVICCHFSTDGKYLASAGHDKKVILWHMETLQTESSSEEHTHIITDVRFRPNSTQLATSSFDTTVRVWDATQPNFSLQTYSGHSFPVTSIDFHPSKTDLFCSCDNNNEIRFWNINQYSCTRVSKGGTALVRFQPKFGQLLAAAANNMVGIFDVETDRQTLLLKGHPSDVHSVCWDATGGKLASVSHESVKVWSLSNGECIHDFNASGNNFQSCIFHPIYSNLLVIGGYQTMVIWNFPENRSVTIPAHECVISALAQSPVRGTIASTSYDKSIKIWK
ncbi:hypothetical protein SAY87_018433 [Trapa incisa]|uniref:Transcriptional corepressor LEUNIG_HOMOLOG-like n=1 Tax=Trapa incisa TaxID=236973 RepID=A0AAN7QVD7_9MYRT|nr:hypothetical protein SAY87_018433 [Trapa incisa]